MTAHNGEKWRIPDLVTDPAQIDKAAAVLSGYFARNEDGSRAFSGSEFERFAGGGDRPEVADAIAVDDVFAVSLLAVHVPGSVALRLLDDDDLAPRAAALLRAIPTDVDLVDATDQHLATAEELWRLVRGPRGMGRTKTSKLLARKRPRMLPVIDSVVTGKLGHANGRTDFYTTLRSELRANDRALHSHLLAIRDASEVGNDISALRCFDVLVWRSGSGPAQAVLDRIEKRA